jgi:rhodanese-related sulfurtransferase
VLLDVRTTSEFKAGHPEGALNIPFWLGSPGNWNANPEFLEIVAANVPKDAQVFVNCQSGRRSSEASSVMVDNGWKDVSNVKGGFGGSNSDKGWKGLGLPLGEGEPEGRSYEALKKKKP